MALTKINANSIAAGSITAEALAPGVARYTANFTPPDSELPVQ